MSGTLIYLYILYHQLIKTTVRESKYIEDDTYNLRNTVVQYEVVSQRVSIVCDHYMYVSSPQCHNHQPSLPRTRFRQQSVQFFYSSVFVSRGTLFQMLHKKCIISFDYLSELL